MRRTKIACALNILLFVLVAFASLWMMLGINKSSFSEAGMRMLKFFTVDSNIFMGITALLMAIEQRRVITGKKDAVSRGYCLLKLVATTCVTLTMLVTVCFLTPITFERSGLFGLFLYYNFFMHLANPILAIVILVGFEKTDCLRWRDSLAGIIPLLLYAAYYMGEAITHSTDGIVDAGYDWYGFFHFGLQSAVVVVPVMLLVMIGIGSALWKLNRSAKTR